MVECLPNKPWVWSSAQKDPHKTKEVLEPHSPLGPQVLSMKKELNALELDFLLRFPFKAGVTSPVDFLQHQSWGGIKVGPGTRY